MFEICVGSTHFIQALAFHFFVEWEAINDNEKIQSNILLKVYMMNKFCYSKLFLTER